MKRNKPFFIAEIGINHNGDINLAKKMIDMAKECECDAVKFQKRTIENVYDNDYLNSPRESPWGKTQLAQKIGLEFSKQEYDEIDRYCEEKDIDWFASAWDVDSQAFLDKYNLKYNKIASAMLTHIPLLKHVAKQGKLTFISTGLSNIEDIDKAHNIFREYNCPYVIMHCVGEYPCPTENLNLNMIKTLKKRYDCPIGYSGHSVSIIDSLVAYTLGADYIEKHITLERSSYGSDQSASLERSGVARTMEYLDYIYRSLGNGKKKVTKVEKEVADKLRYW